MWQLQAPGPSKGTWSKPKTRSCSLCFMVLSIGFLVYMEARVLLLYIYISADPLSARARRTGRVMVTIIIIPAGVLILIIVLVMILVPAAVHIIVTHQQNYRLSISARCVRNLYLARLATHHYHQLHHHYQRHQPSSSLSS